MVALQMAYLGARIALRLRSGPPLSCVPSLVQSPLERYRLHMEGKFLDTLSDDCVTRLTVWCSLPVGTGPVTVLPLSYFDCLRPTLQLRVCCFLSTPT